MFFVSKRNFHYKTRKGVANVLDTGTPVFKKLVVNVITANCATSCHEWSWHMFRCCHGDGYCFVTGCDTVQSGAWIPHTSRNILSAIALRDIFSKFHVIISFGPDMAMSHPDHNLTTIAFMQTGRKCGTAALGNDTVTAI
jgi:hypothetical protein